MSFAKFLVSFPCLHVWQTHHNYLVSVFAAELFCDRTEVHKYIVCITGKRFLILSLWKALGLRRLVTVVLALLSQKTLLWMESFQMHISILLGLLLIYPNTATLKLIFFSQINISRGWWSVGFTFFLVVWLSMCYVTFIKKMCVAVVKALTSS